jgi:hypothetical protein
MQSRETLSTDRDFQHVSTVEYISNMVYELHVRGVSSYHQAEDPRFKTMTAELSHYLDVRTGPTRQCSLQNSRIGF